MKAGELVQVVTKRPCTGAYRHIGLIFRIVGIRKNRAPCSSCDGWKAIRPDGKSYCCVRLKVIPLLNELERKEETNEADLRISE